jgi:death on curing protein
VTRYLALDEVLRGAEAVFGHQPAIRDLGLLESALARPQTTVFGDEAYPTFHEKAAALLHSLVTNHALVDGNKRLAFAVTAVFARLNGLETDSADEDAWFDLLLAVAGGQVTTVSDIAAELAKLLTPISAGPGQ